MRSSWSVWTFWRSWSSWALVKIHCDRWVEAANMMVALRWRCDSERATKQLHLAACALTRPVAGLMIELMIGLD